VDELCAAIKMEFEGTNPPVVIEGDRAYSRSPGFRDEQLALPDDWFAMSGNLTKRIAKGVETLSGGWSKDAAGRLTVTITARAALIGASALDPAAVRIVLAPLAGDKKVPGARRRRADDQARESVRNVSLETSQDGAGTDIRAQIPVDSLLSDMRRLSVRLDVDAAGTTYEIPLAAPGALPQSRTWHRGRPYRVSPIADQNGRLVIAVAPIRPTRVVKQRLRRLTAGAGGTS
jgi:hypothetical protein